MVFLLFPCPILVWTVCCLELTWGAPSVLFCSCYLKGQYALFFFFCTATEQNKEALHFLFSFIHPNKVKTNLNHFYRILVLCMSGLSLIVVTEGECPVLGLYLAYVLLTHLFETCFVLFACVFWSCGVFAQCRGSCFWLASSWCL